MVTTKLIVSSITLLWLQSTLGSGLEARLLAAMNAYGTDSEMTAAIDTPQEMVRRTV